MHRAWALVLTVLCLTGCQDHFYLEKLGYILAISYDATKAEAIDGKLKFGFAIPRSEADKQIFITTEAKSNNEALLTISRENNYQLVKGHLRMVLFGKDCARLGVNQQLDTLIRDSTIRGNVKMIAVDGDAGELLNRSLPQYDLTSLFLNDLLQTTEKTSIIPESDLFTFTRDLYDDAIDPFMPVLKVGSQKIYLSGIGLFQDDKLVDIVGSEQMPTFHLLQGSIHNLNLIMNIQEDEGKASQVGLFHVSGERKITVTAHHPIKSGTDLKVSIELNMSGAVTEYSGPMKLEYPRNQRKLEAYMNRFVEQEAEKMVESLQKKKVDPLGIGQFVRQQTTHAEWKAILWRDVWETADIQVKANMKMKNYGEIQH
ncbi:Ger(x)C family spore germination protein [Brevibacillus nitrificans]|uniref:Ger(X)C family spore germination protein n=1 Tax=Brevibacillus nitrificans TaxID=651560 RepID=A0A3M8D8P6_9BACL|nr:Ger(x)C family spore germination protein [Brevibacillus nitrificans]RNB83951.1 Ger(x)C family spore germination protein [Brevibacillus nitrificans]